LFSNLLHFIYNIIIFAIYLFSCKSFNIFLTFYKRMVFKKNYFLSFCLSMFTVSHSLSAPFYKLLNFMVLQAIKMIIKNMFLKFEIFSIWLQNSQAITTVEDWDWFPIAEWTILACVDLVAALCRAMTEKLSIRLNFSELSQSLVDSWTSK